jgi:hypothetical protein
MLIGSSLDWTRWGQAAVFGAAVLAAPLAAAQAPAASAAPPTGAAGDPAAASSEWTDIDEPCLIGAVHRHINETMPQEIRNLERPMSPVGRGFLISGFASFGPSPVESVGWRPEDHGVREVCQVPHFAPIPGAIRYFLTTATERNLNLNETCPFPFANARFGGNWHHDAGMSCIANGNRVVATNVCTVPAGPFEFRMTSERDRLYFDSVRAYLIMNNLIPEDCKISVRSDLHQMLQTFLDRSTDQIEQLFREQNSPAPR